MNNTSKFHIASSVLNFLIVLISAYVNIYIVELFDPVLFAKRGTDFHMIWIVYIFGFFIVSTFTIYLFKNAKNHMFKLMVFAVTLICLHLLYDFWISGRNYGYEISDLIIYFKNAFQETLPFIIISSIGIHFSQMFLGKKFIPELYKLK